MSFLDYQLHPCLAIFGCATSSFLGAWILQCVSMTYVEISTSCCLFWKATLVPSLHLIYCSYNFPLRQSLACCRCCLVASSWNLPANVSDHLQHFDFFWDVNWVHDEKYPPCPRWFLLSMATPLTSFHRELVHVMDTTCYPACIMFYLEVLLSFMLSMLWGLLHLLEFLGIVILLTITILSWSPCWV
jgi:hypothetical protein